MAKLLPFLAMAGMLNDENPLNDYPKAKEIEAGELLWLIDEYNLIQEKKSNLSRSQRDSIEWRVQRLVKAGKIKPEQIGLPPIEETVIEPSKGDYNVECNRTACSNKNAVFYNHSTQKHYCDDCAEMINTANHADAMRMYGHELCTPVEPS